MADRSSIEWTEVIWHPATGCTKISHGCKFYYAEYLFNLRQRTAVRYDSLGTPSEYERQREKLTFDHTHKNPLAFAFRILCAKTKERKIIGSRCT